jgi:hypothetical protein
MNLLKEYHGIIEMSSLDVLNDDYSDYVQPEDCQIYTTLEGAVDALNEGMQYWDDPVIFKLIPMHTTQKTLVPVGTNAKKKK